MPTVSVIMNAFNAEKYLKEAIDSVYSQTFKDWEIIFWDNASTDKTAEIAKIYDHKLRYFLGLNTVSLGQVRKFAMEQALGKYITILDCDDLWMPNKLEKQLEMYENNPGLGLVYCDGYKIDAQGLILNCFSKDFPPYRGKVFENLIRRSFIPPISVMIKKNVLEDIGLSLPLKTSDDYDLYLKIAYKYSIDFVDEFLFKYRWHDSNLSKRELESHYLEGIEIKKYWLDRVENINKKLLTRELSNSYWIYGNWLLQQKRSVNARHFLFKSLILFPKAKRILKYLLSWLPPFCANLILFKLKFMFAEKKPFNK